MRRKKKEIDAMKIMDGLAALWLLHRSGILESIMKTLDEKEKTKNGS